MSRRARVLSVIAVVSITAAASLPARSAGRKPYGGSIALAIIDDSGLFDPHIAQTREQLLGARLAHCRLFRHLRSGRVVPELARNLGSWKNRTLTMPLVDGATFHDGSRITAGDVVASLKRLGTTRTALAPVFAGLQITAPDKHTVRINAPPGTRRWDLRRALARAEAAVLKRGSPSPVTSHGCGPFRYQPGAMELPAFAGHPSGRPWLDKVILRRAANLDEEIRSFVFLEADLAFVASPRYRKLKHVERIPAVAHASVVAVVHPRFRGPEGDQFRRALAAISRTASLTRHVDFAAYAPKGPWPPEISPTKVPFGTPRAMPRHPGLVIGYPEGDSALDELAKALRDHVNLSGLVSGTARTMPVSALTVRGATMSKSPQWDVALVIHDWTVATPGQAVLEAAAMFGLGGLGSKVAAGADHGRWANQVAERAAFVPILHIQRSIFTRSRARLELGRDGLIDLGSSWVPR